MNNSKTGNKFPVYLFGCDLMNLKILIVLTMVLCMFCVFPVNAYEIIKNPNLKDLGTNPAYNEISVTYEYQEHFTNIWKDLQYLGNQDTLPNNIIYSSNDYLTDTIRIQELINVYGYGFYEIEYNIWDEEFGGLWSFTAVKSTADYDIIIENSENTIELGTINNYNQVFTIGSNQNGIVKNITSYSAYNCYINQLQPNYVIVNLDSDLSSGTIEISGNVEYNGIISQFETTTIINYNYIQPILPTNEIQAFIQTYDYQNGNMLTGVNMSVFEVIENNGNLQLGNMIYSSINADSQTILTVKNNTEYFVKNEKTGYFSVKNTVYDSLNGEIGYLWNPSLVNPLRLYYSRLDENAQYNANFIVQDVNNNGLSGVSVTMDNTVTKVTNSIGGLTFNNISAGIHTFVFVKNGYQTVQQTIDIQLQYAAFYQTMYKDNQIIQPTVQPTAYPTVQPTVQPTISPIDQPSNLAESIKYGLAKMFGVNSLNTINLIFALLIILFPAVVAGVITNQALGFIAGGLIGFVFALGIGLIPIWVFFSMIMLSVIYLVMTHTESGF